MRRTQLWLGLTIIFGLATIWNGYQSPLTTSFSFTITQFTLTTNGSLAIPLAIITLICGINYLLAKYTH